MKRTKKEKELEALCEPVVAEHGLELVLLSFRREGRGMVLRLFVDKPGGRVGIEDCARLSRELSYVLDVEDPSPSQYRLEVSSPGLDRPLVRPEHFERALGRRAKVVLHRPAEGRRTFSGVLRKAGSDGIELEGDFGLLSFTYDQIERANLVPEIEMQRKQKR